ncbi:MAG: methionine/alanine import family NSS transporter small subunit [Nitriliruptorales bacterium]|nr:methionine/alanine import family NSS transporter small subunit [Nitriliruptorales bacterium]
MSGSAIVMMVIGMTVIWGGLGASLLWAARAGRDPRAD